MGKNAFVSVALGLLAIPTAALSEPAYRAADVVNHFASQSLGPTRGLCIGTEVDCGGNPAKTGFDLVVHFDFNSDNLTGQARENLDEFHKALQDARLRGSAFVVEGHTDAKGPDQYNLTLSQRRANAVVRYLTGKGVSPAKLEPRGVGKARPRSPDPYDGANRRVETRLRSD